MGKLAEDMALVSAELAPAWDAERSARLYAGMGKRRARQARVRRAGMAFASLCVVLAGAAFATRASWSTQSSALMASTDTQQVTGTIRDAHTVRLADGSSAQLFGAKSELEIVHNEGARVGLRLHSGRAHFDVVPDTARSFEVEAAPYRVVVLGTVFDVERSSEQVTVSVTRGHVRVYGPRGAVDLLPGQSRTFESGEKLAKRMPPAAPAVEPVADVPAPADEPVVEAERARRTSARRGSSDSLPSWRSLTQNGDYDAAFESLKRQRAVLNDPAELMDAADAARLSNHPDAAVGYLERVVSGHRKSPIAPLAAFTLGRVYLDKLGQPHKAATSFELARTIAPNGSLAQDALAREVEALSKGGDASKAYLRAREYMQRYPRGSRLRAVQLYGGVE